ncbi:MAG: polynucleotide adenylyltransferase PcnB [Pseudomonadota bacterium]
MSTMAAGPGTAPRIIPRGEHNISRKHISKAALKVLYRLQEGGHQAFLVGGAVRDLLLDGRPKDFDVATDAEPDQVHALFRNSRVIGRRFRLVHVRFGREIIEVATFRAASDPADDTAAEEKDAAGRLVRDNVYGSIDDDVWRRDFTANALYYNIEDFSVWDYCGGVQDIADRRLSLIGEPARRLREDPVRVLRALRFVAKLKFGVDAPLAKAIAEHKDLLANVPPARLFDEFLKMFQAGFGGKAYNVLSEYDVFGVLFPQARKGLDAPDGEYFEQFILKALENTDKRVAVEKPVTPMFLIAVFLWWPIKARARALYEDDGLTPVQSLGQATWECVSKQQSIISIPKRFTVPLREMLTLQPRFERTPGVRAAGFLEHKRFRAAYDFMLLRAEIGEVPAATAEFWTDVQTMTPDARAEAFGVASKGQDEGSTDRPRRRRRRRRRKPGNSDAGTE